ncbi:MAG: Glucose-6-phosphate 1-dehydrogenase [Candidatus Anoxychlamydiales bacterium]|nr:Glucose-6-phosphate 1-dehydrogenase [Candidatus Anoxychlamydiales bacterium]HEU64604.1 glucose-6-phosphate dehydrogenase [Chlamydiota bacterium]
MVDDKTFESCMAGLETFKASKFLMVIFGGAGDLCQKKLLPTLFLLYKKGFIEDFTILGFGLPEMTSEEYRKKAKSWLQENLKEPFDEKIYDEKFQKHLLFETADLKKAENYSNLCKKITQITKDDPAYNLMYYLAVPPVLFPTIVHNLSDKELCRRRKGAKIIVEKPFGHDKKSAHALNLKLLEAFDENQIYRIDHYLGKETVQNVFFFRFGNVLFEPLWNRNYIDNIQITVAEDMGIENRAYFYESATVIRDFVQNHILQLIALIAMEPPANFDQESIRNERQKVFKSIQAFDEKKIDDLVVMGQYESGVVNDKKVAGYLDEKGVAKDSKVPTYIAAKFFIDNWRWANVPFYIRTGKRLKKRCTEIAIQFKYPPLRLLGHKCKDLDANTIVFSIYPTQKVSLTFNVKFPGMENIPYPVDMVFDYKGVFKVDTPLAYERVLIDAMKSDLSLFARQDGIETMWGIVDPIIKAWEKKKTLCKYKSGRRGPKEADDFIKKDKRAWRIF